MIFNGGLWFRSEGVTGRAMNVGVNRNLFQETGTQRDCPPASPAVGQIILVTPSFKSRVQDVDDVDLKMFI